MFETLYRRIRSFFAFKVGIRQLLVHQETAQLMARSKHQDPKSLVPFSAKMYSQNGEDGIIQEIFQRIGTTNKIFVEFGIGNGLENNTLALLFSDWKGLWIEGSSKSVKNIHKHFASLISTKQLQISHSFITKENIDDIISNHIKESEIDLLSIDIDGNDYHVLNAIQSISPRVIVLEYNPKFLPPVEYCMEYDVNHMWDYSDQFGASLKSFEKLLSKKGYSLVGCDLVGSNAFFVQNELKEDHFISDCSAEFHYEPARYHLIESCSGHPASYKTLVKRV
jgi:hypothetical protein